MTTATTQTITPPVSLPFRPPSFLPQPNEQPFTPPPSSVLLGTWSLLHTSNPYWSDKRNVTFSYSLPSTPSKPPNPISQASSLDPTPQPTYTVRASYQPLASPTLKTMLGHDTPLPSPGSFRWRGAGWLRLATARWEILGHGKEGGTEWMVSFVEGNLFSAAAVNVLVRDVEGGGKGGRDGGREEVLEAVLEALRGVLEGPGEMGGAVRDVVWDL
ncbi:hypothetical protein M501DRAFT_999572 [Patellaria atrata CBS 101060]|uniref:Uncharacterized protein n=1 Tax=Patellaria atrata CBS 101060 TaxID=1346257 RepID=A0A9P4S4D0_9PEZI|nr:hypothetical protein M501DRAFT_999572 [Patellaria atrata CBS 101060]